MELWKIERFCETATLAQLRQTREDLERKIAAGLITGQKAQIPLRMVDEAIELRLTFGEKF